MVNTDSDQNRKMTYQNTTLLGMLEQHVLTSPDRRAVIYEPDVFLTFKELWTLSGRVYAWLRQRNIGSEDVVMYCLPRGVELYACIVGTLRIGAAFVLAEADNRQKRTEFICKDCSCRLFVDVDRWEEITDTDPIEGYEPIDLHSLCYIAYTSGTTDTPKGVLHEYGSLENAWKSVRMDGTPLVSEEDTFLVMSPMNFVSLPIIFAFSSAYGNAVAIMPYSYAESEEGFSDYIEKTNVNSGYLTPSFLRRNFPFHHSWRMCILSSEPGDGLFFSDMKCYNCYASTESGCLLSVYELQRPMTPAPVGRSQSDIELFILDENEMEVPAGAVGEICYRNPYVRGYLNLPEGTRKLMRGRVFHSGDSGFMNEEGDLIVKGRMDEMFKIGGYRIVPEDIENVVRRVCSLQHFVVRGYVYKDISSIIVFYTDEIEIDPLEMRRRLAELLPEYMIPTNYIRLRDFPLLETGKLDKLSLMPPEGSWDNFRKLSSATLPVIGKGRTSVVYDFGDSKALKVVKSSIPFAMIRQELMLTQAAHTAGLPVPDAYEIVRTGAGYGLIMDRVEGEVLEDKVRSEPDRRGEYICRFAKEVKALHRIHVGNITFMPDVRKVSVSLAEQLDQPFCSKEEANMIRDVFENIPNSEYFIHGDCHTGNAILCGERICFIDMLLCGKGHPVFDLLCMYSHYVFLPSFLSDDECIDRMGVTRAAAEGIFDEFLDAYYPSMSSGERAELLLYIRGIHAARICLADVTMPGVFSADILSKAKQRAIDFSKEYCHHGRMKDFLAGV